MNLLLATRNPGKAREFAQILTGFTVDALPDSVTLPPEDGVTFAQNALGKARAAAAQTGRAAIGDDSGLCSEHLGGGPGVYSARYAGPDATGEQNLAKLIREVPAGTRLAFVCEIAYHNPASGDQWVVQGRCEGTMAAAPAGTNGFGYDPVFIPAEHPGVTMAELSDEQKHAISHRGRAAAMALANLAWH